jgi:hypothetical protein
LKKVLLISSIVLVIGLLIIGFTTPIFAHGPDDGGTTPADGEAWEAMHEACEDGDWEAMAEAAEKAHGEDFDDMPCHDEDSYGHASRWGHMGGQMGRGMMGWW